MIVAAAAAISNTSSPGHHERARNGRKNAASLQLDAPVSSPAATFQKPSSEGPSVRRTVSLGLGVFDLARFNSLLAAGRLDTLVAYLEESVHQYDSTLGQQHQQEGRRKEADSGDTGSLSEQHSLEQRRSSHHLATSSTAPGSHVNDMVHPAAGGGAANEAGTGLQSVRTAPVTAAESRGQWQLFEALRGQHQRLFRKLLQHSKLKQVDRQHLAQDSPNLLELAPSSNYDGSDISSSSSSSETGAQHNGHHGFDSSNGDLRTDGTTSSAAAATSTGPAAAYMELGLLRRYLQLLPPEPKVFTSLMREAGLRGRLDALHAIIEARVAAGLPRDAYTYTALITAADRVGNMAGVRAALAEAFQSGQVSTVLVNVAAGTFLHAGDFEAVFSTHDRMLTLGVPPSTITYNVLISAAGSARRPEQVQQLLADMLHSAAQQECMEQHRGEPEDGSGAPDHSSNKSSSGSSSRMRGSGGGSGALQAPLPDQYTASAVFKAVAGHPGAYSGAWLLQAFDGLQAAGVPPNPHILTAFLSAAATVEMSPSQLADVFSILSDCRAARMCTAPVYTALLTLCARHGAAERAMDIWYAVLEDGVHTSSRLYSALFAAASTAQAAQMPEMLDIVLRAYRQMVLQQQGQSSPGLHTISTSQERQQGSSTAPNGSSRHEARENESTRRVAYNALLHFFAKSGEVGQAAAVYSSMCAGTGGCPGPDDITYNTVIAAYGSVGDLEAAIKLFSVMQTSGVIATSRTYVALMDACAKAARHDVAARLMQLMRENGIKASVQTYTAFMDACVKDGSPESLALAFDAFDAMRAEALAPTAVTYGVLLHACEAATDVERAFALYRMACEEGVLPTDECHNVLIKVCIRAQRLDEALDLVKSLARRHGSMQHHMLNSLIKALAGPYPDRALRLMSIMRSRRMEPNRGTFLALISACAHDGSSGVALSLYRQLRGAGHEPSCQAGSALISSLCKANDLAAAVWVMEDMRGCAQQDQAMLVRRKGKPRGVNPGLPRRSLLPSTAAVGSLVEALTRAGRVTQALTFFWSIQGDERKLAPLTLNNRRMFESLIEACCRRDDIASALEVFDKWKAACVVLVKLRAERAAVAASAGTPPSAANHPVPLSSQAPSQRASGASDGGGGDAFSSREPSPTAPATPAAAVGPAAPTPGSGAPQRKASRPGSLQVSQQQPQQRYPKLSNVTLAFLEACCRRHPSYEWRVYDVCAEMRQAKERKLQAQLARPRKASHHFMEDATA